MMKMVIGKTTVMSCTCRFSSEIHLCTLEPAEMVLLPQDRPLESLLIVCRGVLSR